MVPKPTIGIRAPCASTNSMSVSGGSWCPHTNLCGGGDAAAHVTTSATTALITLPHIMRLSKSFRHQRKSPYRTSGRHVLQLIAGLIAVDAADAGQDRHILPAVLRERHRLRVDARSGLE